MVCLVIRNIVAGLTGLVSLFCLAVRSGVAGLRCFFYTGTVIWAMKKLSFAHTDLVLTKNTGYIGVAALRYKVSSLRWSNYPETHILKVVEAVQICS